MNAGVVWTMAAVLAVKSWHAYAGDGEHMPASRGVVLPPNMPASLAPASIGQPAPVAGPLVRPSAFAPEAARQAAGSTAEQRLERSFIRHAAKVARFEAEASRLALARAQAPAVREFAAELEAQQSAAVGELQRLLHARGMALPMLENSDRRVVVRLARLSGARFDRDYIDTIVQRQQREKVHPYERALVGVADPLLKEWIHRQLPTVRLQKVAAERVRPGPASQRVARHAAPAAR